MKAPVLSAKAKDIIKGIAKAKLGQIDYGDLSEAFEINIDGKRALYTKDMRERADWKSAIAELHKNKLLDKFGKTKFWCLTAKGYEEADKL